MKKKVLLFGSIMMTAALLLSACSNAPTTPTTPGTPTTPNTPAEKKILRTNNSSEPGSLDPALARELTSHGYWTMLLKA